MSAVTVAQRMTAKEFVEAPVPDHGRPWNLVDGEVVLTQPTVLHNRVQLDVLFALEVWTRALPDGGFVILPIDVRLDDRNVFAPDALWYSAENTSSTRPPFALPMPDLAVEVRSPSTWRYDIGAKKAGYERHGLRELWLVDTPANEVLVFRRSRRRRPARSSRTWSATSPATASRSSPRWSGPRARPPTCSCSPSSP